MGITTSENLFGITPPSFAAKSSESKKKEVYGLAYPLHKYKETAGYFSKISGVEMIKAAIRQLVRTEKGERVMLPDFGCSLRRFLFEPLDENIFQAIKTEITTQFNKYIKGASLLNLTVFAAGQDGTFEGSAIKVVLRVQLLTEEFTVFDIPVTLS
jgi:phage baseplate assembly protein W